MKLIQLLEQTSPLTESYVKEVAKRVHSPAAHDVTEAFAQHRKLTGRLERDARAVSAMILMVEDEPKKKPAAKKKAAPKEKAPRKKKPRVPLPKAKPGEFDPFAHLNLGDAPPIDHDKDCLLTYTMNSKLKHLNIWGLSLVAGYTCPFAGICRMLVKRNKEKFAKTGETWYTPNQEHGRVDFDAVEKAVRDNPEHAEVPVTCFSGAAERQYDDTRKMRWRNYDLLRKAGTTEKMADLIQKSLDYHSKQKGEIRLFRMTVDGDFFSQEYFDAWVQVAQDNPHILFYGFTTSIEFWVNRKKDIPKNMRLAASAGSKQADLIKQHKLRKAKVVHDFDHAQDLKLPVDTDDYLAALGDEDFALLVHGRGRPGYQAHTMDNSDIIDQLNQQLQHHDIEQRLSKYVGGKKER